MENKFNIIRTSLILMICFVHCCMSRPSLIENMLDDSCPTFSFLKNSTYLSQCKSQQKPQVEDLADVDANPLKYKDLFMCVMLNDIAHKICAYNSKVNVPSKHKEITMPTDTTKFNEELKTTVTRFGRNLNNICSNISHNLDSIKSLKEEGLPAFKNYVKYVEENMLSKENCKFFCHGSQDDVNPLCFVILWVEEIIKSAFSTKNPEEIKSSVVETVSNGAAEDIQPLVTSTVKTSKKNSKVSNINIVTSVPQPPQQLSGNLSNFLQNKLPAQVLNGNKDDITNNADADAGLEKRL